MQEAIKCRINRSHSGRLPDTREKEEQLCLGHSGQISLYSCSTVVVFVWLVLFVFFCLVGLFGFLWVFFEGGFKLLV